MTVMLVLVEFLIYISEMQDYHSSGGIFNGC